MSLDFHTLGFAALVIALLCSTGIGFLFWLLRGQPGLKEWVVALWLTTAGSALICVTGQIPQWISILAGNSVLVLASGAKWVGARRYCGQPASWRPVVLAVGLILLASGYFTFVHAAVSARIIAFSLATVYFNLSSAGVLLYRGPREVRASCRFAAGIFIAYAALYLLRIGMMPATTQTHDLSALTNVQAPTLLVAIICGVLWVLTFIFLIVHRLIADLADAARIDGLTGALNRRTLEQEGAHTIHFCRRQDLPCAVLMVDMDHFKRVNDHYGHATGDTALRRFAKLVRDALRAEDLFGRYGGDEFCLVLPGCSREGALAVAERLRTVVETSAPAPLDAPQGFTISIGVAAGRGPDLDLVHMQNQADAGLYQAKAEGRNRVVYVAELAQPATCADKPATPGTGFMRAV